MRIDFLSPAAGTSRAHYRDHLQPVWDALADDVRGDWVDSEGPVFPVGRADRAVLVASDTDLRPARVRGYQRIAMISHGIGQSYVRSDGSLYPAGILRQHVGLFLRPSASAAARDRHAYSAATHAVVGSPRLDRLPRGPKKKTDPVVALSFHWTYGAIPETRSALNTYAPALAELAERFSLIGHSHPLAADPRKAFEAAGIEFVPDFAEVCRRARLYVCDNSSTLYEFAATNRPVVVLNTPDYRRDVSHGLRFWEAARVGVQCDAPAELADTIAAALKDPPAVKEARKEAIDIVYAYRRGAAKRAARAIEEWLDA